MSANNRRDISGKTINSWKILNYSHTKGKIAYYNCICLECNIEIIVDGRNIRSGRSKSCFDCSRKRTIIGISGIRCKGEDSRVKYSIEESKYAYLRIRYKKNANIRGYTFNLSLELFMQKVQEICHYCKSKPNTTVNTLENHQLCSEKIAKGIITYNGIDRKDNSIGYEPDNVVTCCINCNRAKASLTVDQFKLLVKKLAANIDNF